ncbi:DUF2155 domain-containing protein [Cognatiyoonia koreensis]|nr:DUF2155 domain-containing protein [Cognatiyoonia koreensis]
MRNILIAFMFCASTAAAAQQATSGPGGELRVLDKVTGIITDLSLTRGESGRVGSLEVKLIDCRYPTSNPSGDAFAELTVTYRDNPEPIFSGWMIASAPALNAMDHPRYDVWALRCMTS